MHCKLVCTKNHRDGQVSVHVVAVHETGSPGPCRVGRRPMNTTSPFPPERWEQTPMAVREYIRTLEARVAALEATVQRLLERLQPGLP